MAEHYTNVQAIALCQTCNLLNYTLLTQLFLQFAKKILTPILPAICEEDTHTSCNLDHFLPFFSRTRDCHNIFYFKVHLANINRNITRFSNRTRDYVQIT